MRDVDPLAFFFSEVPRVFHFLEDEYACRRLPGGVDPRGYAGWVKSRNATTDVIIQYEFGAAPWVVLAPNMVEDIESSPMVSLEFMIANVGGREQIPLPPSTETSNEAIRALLEEKGSWLRRLGHDFLLGRFDGFLELSRRQEQEHVLRERTFHNPDS